MELRQSVSGRIRLGMGPILAMNNPVDDYERLFREDIKRRLAEAILGYHPNSRCAFVPAVHPVDRILNRNRKPRTEIIDVVARKVE